MAAGPRSVAEEITREQLEALKEKFELVKGDRRAFFDTYETTKRANEELLGDLRKKNKELREALGQAQKNAREETLRETTGRDESSVSAELLAHRKRFDTLSHRSTSLREDYEKLRAELSMLTREESAQTQVRVSEAGSRGPGVSRGSSRSTLGSPTRRR